jgi:DUF4097 and DUF4098 domain-containing protein YvlB
VRIVLATALVLGSASAFAPRASTFTVRAMVDESAGKPGEMAEVSDRQVQVVTLPAAKPLSIDITIGSVRIEGSNRADAEIVVERRAPSAAQLARVPLAIDDTPARVSVRAIQTDNTTEAALRADVTVRVPRAALIDRVQVLEGKISVQGFSGQLSADIRRGPIDGRDLSGTLRLEAGIGSVTLTDARLSPNGLLRLRSFNGDVRLSLAERPTDARIMALALNGQVKSEIPLRVRDTWGPRWAEATLGKGEPVISLDVVTGMVEIKSP